MTALTGPLLREGRAIVEDVRRGVQQRRRPAPRPQSDAGHTATTFATDEASTQRWNHEWLRYLGREWQQQLRPHTDYPLRPELPEDPAALYELRLADEAPPLSLYCHGSAIEGRCVMEMGCGCGNLGKLLGRYAAHYLGTDYSTLALQVGRLVSPETCSYVHVGDEQQLARHHATVDTVVGRFFWIHQNLELARQNLTFLADFLRVGGRLYADFYWPDPEQKQGKVFTPDDPLSRAYPSATFRYTDDDVKRAIDGLPYRIAETTIVPPHQRRYVRFERI